METQRDFCGQKNQMRKGTEGVKQDQVLRIKLRSKAGTSQG